MRTPATSTRLSSSRVESSALLTAQELAGALRLNSQTVYRLVRQGVIPGIRIGKKALRFDPIRVREALEARGSIQTRLRPRGLRPNPIAFTRLEDLIAQDRWITPPSDLALERFAVRFRRGIDPTSLAYERTHL